MGSILRKLVLIQEGVVSDNEFREQRGLPKQLLEAFKWVIVFVCAVPHLLHQIAFFYKTDLVNKTPKHLTSSRIRSQKHLLLKVRLTAEDLIRKAERALVSPEPLTKEYGLESFLISVGPHYVAMQIVCNLIKMPTHNHKHVTELYETYTRNLVSVSLMIPLRDNIDRNYRDLRSNDTQASARSSKSAL